MSSNKVKLSKSILDMKFMKRTKEKVEKQQFQEEGEEYFGNEVTKRMEKDSGRFIIEPSYVYCEKLINGRVSYQGMNPEIEKLMELEQQEINNQCLLSEKNKETDVSDEQMVKQWNRLRKNSKNQHRYDKSFQDTNNDDDDEPRTKKPKFLKPHD